MKFRYFLRIRGNALTFSRVFTRDGLLTVINSLYIVKYCIYFHALDVLTNFLILTEVISLPTVKIVIHFPTLNILTRFNENFSF